MLLIFVSIWIFKKFRLLAESKNLPAKKWGWYGVITYLGCGLGGQLIAGVFIGVTNKMYLLDGMGEYGLALICYGLGGLATYVLYQKLSNEEDHFNDRINDFGNGEFE